MAGTGRRGLRDRLGFPALAGRRSLAAAQVADSLGDGMFIPFGVVYFLKTTSLPLHTVGLSLTVAGLLALPAVALSGTLIDRFSPAPMVITGNLVSAVAFACYLTVAHAWQLVTFALLAAAGARLFGAANLALVSDAADPAERLLWVAFLRMASNAGFGLGGLLGSAAVDTGTQTGYHLIAVFQAASCLLAGVLVFAWSRRRQAPRREVRADPPAPAMTASRGGYRTAIADRRLVLLAATNFLFVLCVMALEVLVPVYLIRDLHQRAWLSGALFTINTAIVATGQTIAARAVQKRHPGRVLQAAAVIWGSSFLLMCALGAAPRSVAIPGAVLAVVLYTAAELIQNPTLTAQVIATAPGALRGRYLAVYQASWALGQAVAPGLLTWLLTLGRTWPWLALAAICAMIVLVLSPQTSLQQPGPP